MLSFVLMKLVYTVADHEIDTLVYFIVIFIPAMVAPLVTWHLFGLLKDFYKSENIREMLLEELQEIKVRLQASQKIAKLGSWHFDIQANRVFWSDEIYRIFEIDPERFGASYEAFLDAVHPDDRDMVNHTYLQSLEDKQPYSIDHRLKMADGRIKYVHEECVSLFNENGGPISSTGTVQDITEQVLLRQESDKKQKMLLQQSKMAQMGEMLSSIAHQWKQPLAQVNSVLLEMENTYDQKQLTRDYFHQRLDKIETLTTHMAETIEDFRNFFEPDKSKEVFDANEAVEELLSLLDTIMADEKIELKVTVDQQLKIHTYKQELIQVLLILINNARDALLEEAIEQPVIAINAHEESGKVCFEVEDNAKGVPDTIIERIFEPYFTTKEFRGGTGLGLYLAKLIIENSMQGELQVESSQKGSVFRIFIDKTE